MPRPDQHYFQQREAYRLIASLASRGAWVVYVGLGATIDQTDVDWPTLVHRLLRKFSRDTGAKDSDIERWIDKQTPQRAATTAETLFRRYFPNTWENELQNSIRAILYGPRRNMAGSIVGALADWAHAIASKGGSVVFVTPNYDEYLWQGLLDFNGQPDWAQAVQIRGPYVPQVENVPVDALQHTAGQISCIHIHGFVPDKDNAVGVPTLGEVSYIEAAGRTLALLKQLFDSRNVLIVGSSLADAPVVQGLMETSAGSVKRKRLAIQPYQGSEWRDDVNGPMAGVKGLNDQRLKAMTVESFSPHFYGQISQVLFDASHWVAKGTPNRLLSSLHPARYSRRVERWWQKWSNEASKHDSQQFHHSVLLRALEECRIALRADDEEGMKVELWVRWEPNDLRELALWAQSSGTWVDPTTMRRTKIEVSNRHKAVQVFCAGAPMLFEEDEQFSRWRSYYGCPIWHRSKDYGNFIAGVVMLASMRPGTQQNDDDGGAQVGGRVSRAEPTGSISESNLELLQTAREWLEKASRLILVDAIPVVDREAAMAKAFGGRSTRRAKSKP